MGFEIKASGTDGPILTADCVCWIARRYVKVSESLYFPPLPFVFFLMTHMWRKENFNKVFFLIQHMFSFIKKEFQIPTWVEITIFSIFPHMFFGSQIQNSNWSFLFVQAQNKCAYWLSDGCQLQCIQVKLLTEDVRWSEATHLIRHHFHVMHCAHVWSFSFVTAE